MILNPWLWDGCVKGGPVVKETTDGESKQSKRWKGAGGRTRVRCYVCAVDVEKREECFGLGGTNRICDLICSAPQ